MACCSEPGEQECCSRKRGCCTAGVYSILLFFSGLGLIAMAVVVPIIVQRLVDEGLCDQVCIPKSTDAQWQIDNWLYNTNRSVNPEEYLSFHIYNLTNADDVQRRGAIPNVTLLGPYTWQVERRKYNTWWSADEAEVAYETFEQYKFRHDLSNGSETDTFITINMPFLSGVNAVKKATEKKASVSIAQVETQCAGNDWHGGSTNQACLFQQRSVRDTFFGSYQQILMFGNVFLFNGQINTNFQVVFNCSASPLPPPPVNNGTVAPYSYYESCHETYTQQQNFGMGGGCTPESVPGPWMPHMLECAWNDTFDFRTHQLTGHGSMDDVAQMTVWLGNSTLDRVWNSSYSFEYNTTVGNTTTTNVSTVDTPQIVKGTDHYQFNPDVHDDDILTIWDDLIMRHVDMHYIRDTSYLGVDMLRFGPTEALYGNRDPFYWGGREEDGHYGGMLNISGVSTIRYGSETPMFVTRPYQWGASSTIRNQYVCSNCPTPAEVDAMNIDDVDSFIDVEPTTGKVLRGQKRAQIHAHIGDPYLFNTTDPTATMYTHIPNVFVPVFILSDGATMTDHQADLVKDGLSKIRLANIVRLVAVVVGSVVGALFLISSFYLGWRFRKLGGWRRCCGGDEDESIVAVISSPDNDYLPLNYNGGGVVTSH